MTEQEFRQFIAKNDWREAKTWMRTYSHEYIVRGNLSAKGQRLFDAAAEFIAKQGYQATFFDRTYSYYDAGKYKYWAIEDILNRTEI